MRIIACQHPKYKYHFDFEHSVRMEWYCKLLNKDEFVMFFEDKKWMFNSVSIIEVIRESFPEVEISEDVEMDLSLENMVLNPYTLRSYQKEAVDKGVEFMMGKEKKGGLLVVPTAGGKSLVIASIAQRLPGKTLVLQPSKEILEQNLKKANDFGFKDIGVFSASAGRKDLGKLTFATIGSIINKKELFVEFTNLLIDESHGVNSKGGMYEEFISFFGGKCLGLTATPYRLHSYNDLRTGERAVVAKFLTRTRPNIFTTILQVTQVQELYAQGFLCPIKYEFNSHYNQKKIKLNSTGADFDQEDLEKYNEEVGVIKIVSDNIKGNKSKHVLVFSSSVKEAELLTQDLLDYGIKAATVSAKTPKVDRENILEDFKKGVIKVVTNVGTMTTGYDFPELDCIILARPTQSVALYYQIMGRGLRIAPGKNFVRIVDVCGNVTKFGRIETFEIVASPTGVRLKSNLGYLTGVNFASMEKEDLEIVNYKNKEESSGYSSDIVNFGKYKGIHVSKLPQSYMIWCIEKMGADAPFTIMAKKELRRRLEKKAC